MHNTPSAASLSRFGLGHVRKHTPFALTLSSLHLWHSAKSLPKKRCFSGERPFCKGLMRLLHEGDLLRCFRNSVSVTYVSTLPSTSSLAPCISSFVQSLSTFETNVREWHFVRHSPNIGIRISPDLVTGSTQTCNGISTDTYPLCHRRLIGW